MPTIRDVLHFLNVVLNYEVVALAGTSITFLSIITFLVIVLLTIYLSKILQATAKKTLLARGVDNEGSLGLVKRLTHYVVLAIGLTIALQFLGIDLGSLFAAGAVFAVGIGFAMQTIAQNFVAGVLLLVERTIRPGDVLAIDGQTVKVIEMGIRATIVKTWSGENLILPNSNLVQSKVTNYTLRNDHYRIQITVGVDYNSDMNKVKLILENVGKKTSFRIPDKEVIARIIDFGDSSVVFELLVWAQDPWQGPYHQANLRESVWFAFKQENVVISFPQLDLHLDNNALEAISQATKK